MARLAVAPSRAERPADGVGPLGLRRQPRARRSARSEWSPDPSAASRRALAESQRTRGDSLSDASPNLIRGQNRPRVGTARPRDRLVCFGGRRRAGPPWTASAERGGTSCDTRPAATRPVTSSVPPCWTPSRGGAPPSSTSASTPQTPCDFLDTVGPVCAAVTEGRTDRDLLFSGTGVGACIAANKLPVVRAARCHDAHSTHRSVEHDDADVFCFGAHIVCPRLALVLLRICLFAEEEPFRPRLAKVAGLERSMMPSVDPA